MPYILIRGNLASYGHKNPWRVLVSGLKGGDIEQLKRFACGGYSDDSTIVYLQHPCVILSALEVLGYKVVASSSTAVKQDYNEYMWTMRKEFAEPEPTILVERENITNFSKEAMNLANYPNSKDDEVYMNDEMDAKGDNACVKSLVPLPDDGVYGYVAIKGSLHAHDCCAFGLGQDEVRALTKKFPGSGVEVVNGVTIKSNVIDAINVLSQLGYKIASSTGETEITWTLQQHGEENHVCKCAASGVTQTLDEMDWERGIWYAALLGDEKRVETFLGKEGAARAADGAGYTALHYAARAGHAPVCRALLRGGACVDARTKNGMATPLHRAAAAGHLEIVELLLRSGACVEAQDADGQTPLHKAAELERAEVISMLVNFSPKLKEMQDNRGRTAAELSSSRNSDLM